MSDWKSLGDQIRTTTERLDALKGGPGSGRHSSYYQSDAQKATDRANRFTDKAESSGKSLDHLAAYQAHMNAAVANQGTNKESEHTAKAEYHSEQYQQEKAGEKEI